nr:reverse transcriptase domain-containing protein [Tanacetum cinerariifolium]
MSTLTDMMSKFVSANTASSSGSGTLPGNTITNPKEELKGITTRSGIAYQGPKTPSPSKEGTKVTKDQVKNPSSQNNAPVQPSVIQSESQASVSEPVVAPVSAPMPNLKPFIPYPSRRDNEKRRDQANEQIKKFYEIFKEMSFEISITDALILMAKFASTLKALIGNKEKLCEMARTTMNKQCSTVILNKLPRKLGDPRKFLIPCEFSGMDECLALADLDPRVPLILGRCFLKTSRAFIDVHKGELTLRIRNEAITYNLDQTVRYSANYNQMTANKIDVIESACEEYSQEVLGFSNVTTSSTPTPKNDPIVFATSPALTPFGDSDFLLFEEADAFLGLEDDLDSLKINSFYYDKEWDILLLEAILNTKPSPPLPNQEQNLPSFKEELKAYEAQTVKPSVDEPPEVELKDLPHHLEYTFLEGDNKLPVIIAKELRSEEKAALIKVLKSHKRAIAWKLSDIQGINPEFYTHKILMEEDYKLAVQNQRWVNPKIHNVIKKEVEKFLDLRLIYPISDSPWVSPVCIDYRKLNEATRKGHFPLPFMDQMLKRLAGNEYYCFLDGFSGYFQIPIDPRDEEKTTFTCPYGTFAYRCMPFGLYNAPGTFQRMSLEISFTDALILMPKFASTLKALIRNKEKLSEMARTTMNKHCSVVILNKLPRKLGDPGKFLIPCEFSGIDECLALADLSASINLMPLSVWEGLSLPKLTPTCMTLELLDRSVSKPIGIAKDVSFKVGVFHFPANFVVVDFEPDPRLTLRIGNEAITYNLDQTVRYSANYNQMTANKINVIESACEEYSQEVLGFSNVTTSGTPTPHNDPIVSTTSPTLTPFGDNDFLLFEEADAFLGLEDDPDFSKINPFYYDPEGDILLLEDILNSEPSPPLPNQEQNMPSFKEELKDYEAQTVKSSVDEPPKVELKDLPHYLEYEFLAGDNKLPIIIAKELRKFCTHKIRMEEDYKPAVQNQRRINPKIHDVIKKEVEKLLDAGLIYPISDSPWVSPVHCVPKKGGFTMVENEEKELIPTHLGASINLMPLSVWEGLSLPELTLTYMTLELADRSVSKPIGIAKDVSFKVGVFHFPADFVVVDFEPDPRVPLILRRCFLKTIRALIDVHKGELTLRIGNEAITYNLDQTVRYFANYNQMTANKIDVVESTYEEYSQEVLSFSNVTSSGTPTPQNDPIVFATSPTLTPFGDSDFLLFEEADAFLGLEDDPDSPKINSFYYDPEGDILLLEAILNSEPSPPLPNQEQNLPSFKEELKAYEAQTVKSSVDEPPKVELKDLPHHLEYTFLEGDNKLLVIIAKELGSEEKSALIKVLKSHKRAIAWKLSDIQGINPEFYTHKILMEEDCKPAVQHQRRVNPNSFGHRMEGAH